MKKEIWLIMGIMILIGIAIAVKVGTSNFKYPKIELSTTSFDLGDIDPDEGIRTETFFVKNRGTDVLKIVSTSTSCGCTEAEVESEEIVPGEQTRLIVKYDPSVHPNLTGPIKRIVYVKSNDPSQDEIELELTGNILKGGQQ